MSTNSTKTSELHTLTYPIDTSKLGTVTVYDLDERFRQEWDKLTSHVRRNPNSYARPRYSDLASALIAVTSQPIKLFPSYGSRPGDPGNWLMVTTEPVNPAVLERTFTIFERLTREDDAGKLGRLVTEAPVSRVDLDSLIERGNDGQQLAAPWWFLKIAMWSHAAKIAESPLTIDGQTVQFRLDSEANLVAWDRPIVHEGGRPRRRLGVGTIYLETSLRWLSGATDLYFQVEPHLARIPRTWFGAKNAWIARDDTSPLLNLPVTGPWPDRGLPTPTYRSHAAAITQACQMAQLPEPPEDPLAGDIERFRLIGKTNTSYPIGRATGVRFAFQVQEQIAARLGQEALRFAGTGFSAGTRIEGAIAPKDLDTAVETAGIDALRIVVLYNQPHTRERLIKELSGYTDHPGGFAPGDDKQPASLTSRVSVAFEHAPRLLEHGDHTRDLSSLTTLDVPDATTVVALVETTLPPQSDKSTDAKPRLRKALGARGIVSQFLRADDPASTSLAPEATDHHAKAAVRDLFRATGVIDHRLSDSLAKRQRSNSRPLDRSVIFVGMYLRQNTPRKGRGGPHGKKSMIVSLVALQIIDETNWSVRMYDAPSGLWLPYRDASSRYFTMPIGDETIDGTYQSHDALRMKVDTAIKQLSYDQPVVIFLDPHAGPAEKVWPGLRCDRDSTGALPGTGSEHPDLAIVSIRTGTNAVRPTHRGINSSDHGKPLLPGQEIYLHREGETPTWLLAQPSRVFRGSSASSRIGAQRTRWSEGLTKARMKEDWHLLSGIEIAVPSSGTTFTDQDLAVYTARLCNQPVSWDDRTRYPAPLHLATSVVKDHPGFIPEDTEKED